MTTLADMLLPDALWQRISRCCHRPQPRGDPATGGTESLGTVAIAISTDLAMSVAKAVAAGADLQADGREDPADGVVGSPGHDDDPDDHEGAESEQ